MLGLQEDELEGDADLLDGVGEVANMVSGGAKTALQETPHHFSISLPTAMAGGVLDVSRKAGSVGVILECHVGGEPLRLGIWSKGVV